jgi:hypothetical protein
MKMIKIVLLVAGSLFSVLQSLGQVHIGIHGGSIAGIATVTRGGLSELENQPRIGWKTGAVADIPLSKKLSLMPQLNILSKGGKADYQYTESFQGVSWNVFVKEERKLTYLELPINLIYKKGKYWIGGGPSFSLGVHGLRKTTTTRRASGVESVVKEEQKIVFNPKHAGPWETRLKPFELGINMTGLYRFDNGLFVQAVFNKGLSNVQTVYRWRNNYFGIGLGYFFKASKK